MSIAYSTGRSQTGADVKNTLAAVNNALIATNLFSLTFRQTEPETKTEAPFA